MTALAATTDVTSKLSCYGILSFWLLCGLTLFCWFYQRGVARRSSCVLYMVTRPVLPVDAGLTVRWHGIVTRLISSVKKEAREFAVALLRRRWGKLGNLLRRHPWAINYRVEHFRPIWTTSIVKQWARLTSVRVAPVPVGLVPRSRRPFGFIPAITYTTRENTVRLVARPAGYAQ